jgi:small subunit ribosomal protein S20
LRSALRGVRSAIDGNDLTGAKQALRETMSLIDRMASKGIIHRNAAGRYKSRLARRVAGKSNTA